MKLSRQTLGEPSETVRAGAPTAATHMGLGAPAMPEAERIAGQSLRDWCAKLERKADATGNPRFRQQARNIRWRFGVAP